VVLDALQPGPLGPGQRKLPAELLAPGQRRRAEGPRGVGGHAVAVDAAADEGSGGKGAAVIQGESFKLLNPPFSIIEIRPLHLATSVVLLMPVPVSEATVTGEKLSVFTGFSS